MSGTWEHGSGVYTMRIAVGDQLPCRASIVPGLSSREYVLTVHRDDPPSTGWVLMCLREGKFFHRSEHTYFDGATRAAFEAVTMSEDIHRFEVIR